MLYISIFYIITFYRFLQYIHFTLNTFHNQIPTLFIKLLVLLHFILNLKIGSSIYQYVLCSCLCTFNVHLCCISSTESFSDLSSVSINFNWIFSFFRAKIFHLRFWCFFSIKLIINVWNPRRHDRDLSLCLLFYSSIY